MGAEAVMLRWFAAPIQHRGLAFVSFVSFAFVALGFAQSAGEKTEPIKMRTLRPGDSIYVLIGAGGNSLALMRDDGVVLIDTKSPAGGKQILDTIQAVSDRP